MLTRTWASADRAIQVVISLHGREPPTDREWAQYMESLRLAIIALKGDKRGIRGFSISDGGGPTAAQREQVNAFMREYTGSRGRISIITSNPFVRAIITALRLFNPQARGFAPSDLSAAIDYLGLTPEQRSEFEFALNQALLAFPLLCARGTRSSTRPDILG